MKTLRITAPRKVGFFEIPLPEVQDDQVQVKLEITCLCGSDSPFFKYDFDAFKAEGRRAIAGVLDYKSPSPSLYPLHEALSLHECVGTVTRSRAKEFQEGDLVLALPFNQHGFSEYLTLPSDRIFKLSLGPVSKKEILMCQPLGTILYGFRKLPSLVGKTVAIIGQGPIGLMMDNVLSRMGPSKIIAIDKLAYRAELGLKMGATHQICNLHADATAALLEINHGQLADVVIECAGHNEYAIDLAVDLTRHDGSILNFGVIDDAYVDHFPLGKIFFKNISLLNTVGAKHTEHFLEAARRIASGEIDVKPLLTHTFPLSEAQQAYEHFVDRKDGAIKVLIDFQT